MCVRVCFYRLNETAEGFSDFDVAAVAADALAFVASAVPPAPCFPPSPPPPTTLDDDDDKDALYSLSGSSKM